MRVFKICVAMLLLGAGDAQATPITSPADPALTGATLQDFNSASACFCTISVDFGNVEVTGPTIGVHTGSNGQYVPPNPPGDIHVGGTNEILRFTFDSPVNAFGILVGVTNAVQTITAFDTGGFLIESASIPDQVGTLPYPHSSFHGFASTSANILSFTVTTTNDTVLFDDLLFSITPIPEPSTALLVMTGLLSLACNRRRRVPGEARIAT